MLNDKGDGPRSFQGEDAFFHNSSSDDEYSYNKYSGASILNNYGSPDIWGNRHQMAQNTGSYSNEIVLFTQQFPGMPAGFKTNGFSQFY